MGPAVPPRKLSRADLSVNITGKERDAETASSAMQANDYFGARYYMYYIYYITGSTQIRTPISVYSELARGNDQLARRMRQMKKASGLFVTPDAMVQKHFGEIAVFVQSRYDAPQASHFLSGADPWVIAHAFENQGTVVTHEVLVGPESKKPKIPNICKHFEVRYVRAFDAFARLGLKL